jgi:hypothetical protein
MTTGDLVGSVVDLLRVLIERAKLTTLGEEVSVNLRMLPLARRRGDSSKVRGLERVDQIPTLTGLLPSPDEGSDGLST